MAETRVTTTSTGQYDMLLAMSQDSINAALAAMWDLDGDDIGVIEFDRIKAGMGSIRGKIEAPDMQVIADGTGRGSVLFRLNFASGTAKLYDEDLEDFDEKSMKGFKIAFTVDIACNDVHAEVLRIVTKLGDSNVDPRKKASLEAQLARAKNTIEKFGKQAGDFSIQQLFVNFATANISSLSQSELELPGLDPAQVTSFSFLLLQWLTANKTSNNTTLGYGLAVDPAKKSYFKVADCLIPTSVNLQTYPYKGTPTADPKLGWTGEATRNCLVYCNMTANNQVSGERTLAWSGNFTTIHPDKESRVDGTAIIKRQLFLDRFVVPMLCQYNDDMQLVATKMEIMRDGEAGQRRYHWSYGAELGHHPSYPDWTSDYFQFRQNSEGAALGGLDNRKFFDRAKQDGFDAVTRAEGVSWSWSRFCSTELKQDNQDWHRPQYIIDWADHLSGQTKSDSTVHVVPVPGEGIIKIRGYTQATVVFDGYYTRLFESNLEYKGDVGVYAHWQVDIVCSSSEQDGMRCRAENERVFKYSVNEVKGVPENENNADNFIKTLMDSLDSMLEKKESICQAINDALSATGKFSHPAAGSFDFRDPIFNRRGDLLVTAEYKAPVQNGLFQTPEIGNGARQRAPGDVGKHVSAEGDTTAPIGKKGG
ncbi:hypothetical protein QBC43DRAFT_141549 [Cladorrhinum sp. PSN259]|nr:hypothetical protein QBC43DRAFT_141549 [Cladorrhinum sp. PSN259]